MDKFTTLTGVAAPLPIVNVDTDMIIPKEYLKTIKRTGLGNGLFAEMRYKDDGSENPDFVLNKPAYRKAQDHRRRRQFRLRLEPRARAVGAARFRHPLRDLDQLRRHFLQQLLQERHPADHRQPGRSGEADGRRLARLQRDASPSTSKPRKSAGRTAAWSSSTSTTSSGTACSNGLDDIGLTMEKAGAIDAFEKKNADRAPLGLSGRSERIDPAAAGRFVAVNGGQS